MQAITMDPHRLANRPSVQRRVRPHTDSPQKAASRGDTNIKRRERRQRRVLERNQIETTCRY